jgi:hypothetical protein
MAFTGTTSLSLPIITSGTESGLWGNITNNGLTEYLDIAVAGALSITATTTLSNTSGSSSATNIGSTTAQYRTLIIPASGPSANIVITAPSSNRVFHVVNRNATYTVQIRAGVNSGVTVGVSQSATVAYDSVAADYVLVGPIGPITPPANGGTGVNNSTRTLTINTNSGTLGFPSASTVMTFPSATDTVAGIAATQTLTNKRVDPRVSSSASASSVTPDIASYDMYAYTALAANLTINAPTGTPVDGNTLLFRILDDGTSRTLTWNATFTAIGASLPTATTASKMIYVGCIYNAANTRWDVISVSSQV